MLAKNGQASASKGSGRKIDGSARMRLIEAAAALFRARGYAAVSLREIAAVAGVTTGTVYHHFGSKDDTVEEVLQLAHRHILECVRNSVESLPADAPPIDRLRAAINAHIAALFGEKSLPAATTRIFSQVPRFVRTAALPARHEYEDYWFALLLECQKDGVIDARSQIELVTPLLFGAMNWLLEWYKPARFSNQAITDQLIQMLR